MPAITAAQIKAENDWDDDTISDTNLEYLIDNIINYVNLVAGSGISNLTGAAGSKTVTVSSNQDPVLKSGIALAVRAYTDKGPNVALGALNVAQIVQDPHYKFMNKLFMGGIGRLRGRSFERT